MSHTATAIPGLFVRYKDVLAAGQGDLTDDEMDATLDAEAAVIDEIAGTPGTLADAADKLRVTLDRMAYMGDTAEAARDEVRREHCALIASALRDIEAALSTGRKRGEGAH